LKSNFKNALRKLLDFDKGVGKFQKKYKFISRYYKSFGYMKFKIIRQKKSTKGYTKYRSSGILRLFNLRATHQPRPRSFIYKRYAFRLGQYLKQRAKDCFLLFFMCLQSKFSSNFNFIDFNFIENFNLYLYFLLDLLMLKLYKNDDSAFKQRICRTSRTRKIRKLSNNSKKKFLKIFLNFNKKRLRKKQSIVGGIINLDFKAANKKFKK
jgi:hypothetical protein